MEIAIGALWYMPVVPDVPVPSSIYWNSEDPLTVVVTFGNAIVWAVARDLLNDAIGSPGEWTGDGDVKAGNFAGDLHLRLASPSGSAELVTSSTEAIESFLVATYEVSPRNQEELNVDAWIEGLLS